jgi:OOP family OmpA-OmpF porin
MCTSWLRRCVASTASLFALVALSGDANAQGGAVSAERFQPAPGPRNFLTVETARVDGDMSYSFGVLADYANDPFRLRHCLPGPCSTAGSSVSDLDVIKNLVTANLLASITPTPRLQIGLRVPIAYASGQGVDLNQATAGYGQPIAGGVSGVTLGDPALELKVRALGQAKSPVTAGLSASISAPIGQAISPELYVGDSSPVGTLRAIVDADLGRFFVAANVGGAFRSTTHLGTLDLGPEFRAGVGAGVRPTPELAFLVEGVATTNFTTDQGTNTAEADLAARYAFRGTPVIATLGGGAGLNEGIGAPTFRIFLGLGVNVERGASPGVDQDIDKDGIPNDEDRCPLEGGDVVRLPGKFYGCPKRDSDGDGIPDFLDACPDQRGVASNDPALNGCEDPDRDHDGIPNDRDKCPDAPETYNGFEDADGCPDTPPIRVEVRSDQIVVINETINFDFKSERIVGTRSFEALDMVVEAIKAHPEIKQIEVAGHTDSVGPRDVNLRYSKARAAVVVAYLVSKGVAPSRLVSNGYGPDKPVSSNETEEGRAQNRRVQFNILLMFK